MIKPTKQQIEWAKQEIGVIIHYDINVFEPSYDFRKQWGYHPDPKVFNPTELDTDQWIKTAKAAGAKYAILVTKHCTGFALFPTEPYSVKQSSYKGDIVDSFVKSCKKYGVKPGFYYSCACNGYMQVDNPGKVISGDPDEQKRYTDLVERQLTELWSRYGKAFEIWFDGGLLTPENGGPDIKAIYEKYQPQAVRFQGSALGLENTTRWVGNERGFAPYDCWSATDGDSQFDGTVEDSSIGAGNPDGSRWSPAECDTPNRKNEWFWKKNEEKKVLSAERLTEYYYKSVGRNCNLLLGMVIDNRGLVPDKDAEEFTKFGQIIKKRTHKKIKKTSGSGSCVKLKLPHAQYIDHIFIREDIESGHAVRDFSVDVLLGGKVKKTFKAKAIGNKRIFRFNKIKADEIVLNITESKGEVKIPELSCSFGDDFTTAEKIRIALERK